LRAQSDCVYSIRMISDDQLDRTAIATAEEILRVIYGDDLQGCAVSLDSIAAVIRTGLEEHARIGDEIAALHAKAFEAVQLLATPPADGTRFRRKICARCLASGWTRSTVSPAEC
jgi:hypothetical protein